MSAESAAFHSTAAQVLPVLFLAVVFEQRIWSAEKGPTRVFGLITGQPRGRFFTAVSVLIFLLPVNLFVGE